jgi:hypothetical protein
MSEPNGGGSAPAAPPKPQTAAEKAAAEKPWAEAAAANEGAELAVLAVVQFTHEDPIFNVTRDAIGVVVGIDDQGVDVVPLAGHRLRVNSEDVYPLHADELYGDDNDADED